MSRRRGPIERELRRWSTENASGQPTAPLNDRAKRAYLYAIASLAITTGAAPDEYEDVMSEAIEAAEALGL